MAFTNTPESSTHQVKIIPVIGGQTFASNVVSGTSATNPRYQGQRYINCYPKRLVLENTDDKWVLTKCPPVGRVDLVFSGSGTDKITTASSDGKYVWKGKRLYSMGGSPVLVYTATNEIRVKSMFLVTNPTGDSIYAGMFRDTTTGTNHSYTFNPVGAVFTQSASLPFLESSEDTPFQSAFFNGRLYSIGMAGRIYNTAPGNYTSWSTIDFIVPEIKADFVVGITIYKNQLVAFNTQSIEFFIDAAIELGSPLQRQESNAQLYGLSSPLGIGQTGDNIYFLSYEDRLGFGLYTLDNFVVKRISNAYIDTLLNNDDVLGSGTKNHRIFMIDMYGDPCVALLPASIEEDYVDFDYVDPGYVGAAATAVPNIPLFCYSSRQRLWFEFVVSSSSGYDWTIAYELPGMMQLPVTPEASQFNTYFVHSYGANGATTLYQFTKDYETSLGSTAEVVLDATFLGVNHNKHIKYIDALGDFGDNTVGLSWTPNINYTNWSAFVDKQQSSLGYRNAIRWRNLGLHRSSAYRLRFQGATNISFEGLQIAYNLYQL